ncbi:MAG: Holliday junction branch migration protein RuvA [Acidimicrobiaceae bacterium]|nr:Holliday junction branch migration protein RuvA [Acidimicrobiaceae bacterium]
MIGSLRGRLLERSTESELLIEVGGLGYRVQATPTTAVSLGEVGEEVFMHTHHAVREDSDTLYGFSTIDERRIFESLISAHGVGPALGLAILSVHGPTALRLAVAHDDLAALCLVPGVGRKTAARLVMELKSKLDLPSDDSVGVAGETAESSAQHGIQKDVRAALESLGYGPEEIHAVLVDMPAEGETSELLRDALRRLATGV